MFTQTQELTSVQNSSQKSSTNNFTWIEPEEVDFSNSQALSKSENGGIMIKTPMNNISNVKQMSAGQVFTQLTDLQLGNILSIADVYYYANIFELKSMASSKSSICL